MIDLRIMYFLFSFFFLDGSRGKVCPSPDRNHLFNLGGPGFSGSPELVFLSENLARR